MKFRADVFTWIPQPEVPNPLHSLPGGTGTWGAGACGPHFGGDNFTTPPISHTAWTATFRAKQTLEFEVPAFGDPPNITVNTGCVPGTTTVLSAPRSAGGTVCHSLTATVKTSTATVTFDSSNNWYRLQMHGEAQDPVPAAVARGMAGNTAGSIVSAAVPNLEWNVDLRFQNGSSVPYITQARYLASRAISLDGAAAAFPARSSLGSGGRLVHGLITLRRFPSLVLYVTIDSGSGSSTMPLYFADASGRTLALAQIVVAHTDVLRQIGW